jgi:hypothetical protein
VPQLLVGPGQVDNCRLKKGKHSATSGEARDRQNGAQRRVDQPGLAQGRGPAPTRVRRIYRFYRRRYRQLAVSCVDGGGAGWIGKYWCRRPRRLEGLGSDRGQWA